MSQRGWDLLQTKFITWADLRRIVEEVITDADYDIAKGYNPDLAEDPEHETFDDVTDRVWSMF